MPDENAPVVITNRDVYELLQKHMEKVDSWQETHAASDTKAFTSLNVKFYGLLAGIVTVLAALFIPHT